MKPSDSIPADLILDFLLFRVLRPTSLGDSSSEVETVIGLGIKGTGVQTLVPPCVFLDKLLNLSQLQLLPLER